MSWSRFQNLPGTRQVADQLGIDDCKCDVIAHYRQTRLFEAVMMDLQEKYPEKKHGT